MLETPFQLSLLTHLPPFLIFVPSGDDDDDDGGDDDDVGAGYDGDDGDDIALMILDVYLGAEAISSPQSEEIFNWILMLISTTITDQS